MKSQHDLAEGTHVLAKALMASHHCASHRDTTSLVAELEHDSPAAVLQAVLELLIMRPDTASHPIERKAARRAALQIASDLDDDQDHDADDDADDDDGDGDSAPAQQGKGSCSIIVASPAHWRDAGVDWSTDSTRLQLELRRLTIGEVVLEPLIDHTGACLGFRATLSSEQSLASFIKLYNQCSQCATSWQSQGRLADDEPAQPELRLAREHILESLRLNISDFVSDDSDCDMPNDVLKDANTNTAVSGASAAAAKHIEQDTGSAESGAHTAARSNAASTAPDPDSARLHAHAVCGELSGNGHKHVDGSSLTQHHVLKNAVASPQNRGAAALQLSMAESRAEKIAATADVASSPADDNAHPTAEAGADTAGVDADIDGATAHLTAPHTSDKAPELAVTEV